MKKMTNFTEWFKEEEKLRIDESQIKGGKAIKIKKAIESTTESEDLTLRSLAID